MITVDAMGDACPLPVIKTKKAMESRKAGEALEVFVDNETAVKNVMKMASSQGAEARFEKKSDTKYRIIIGEGASREEDRKIQTERDIRSSGDCTRQGDTVVAVTSEMMGSGDGKLGRMLMKGFIFALTQLDRLPDTILFYNGGARLTAEGSESLEDLRKMEEQGTVIMTCGTCLDFYGIKDKLAVGSVTNMYAIAETMSRAGKIIRP